MVLPPRARATLLTSLLLSVALAGTASGQGRSACGAAPPSIGAVFGRSSPYVELTRGAVDVPAHASVSVDPGWLIAGRAEMPVAGPLRLRLEAGRTAWAVRQTTYDPEGWTVTSERSAGAVSVRHLAALVGVRTGRAPVCAQVSAGGGLYALRLGGASVRRPGAVLAAGLEIPAGEHGVVQAEAVLHVIATRGVGFTGFSSLPALNLVLGWAYRF